MTPMTTVPRPVIRKALSTGTSSAVAHDGWRHLGALGLDTTIELHITRVFSGVGRGLEGRAGFMFAGCCWWRSLAVGGGSGTSRGHAPVMRGPGSRRRGAAARHPAPPREPLVA